MNSDEPGVVDTDHHMSLYFGTNTWQEVITMTSFLKLLFGGLFLCGALALVVLGILAFFDLGYAAGLYEAPAWFIFIMALAFAIPVAWIGVLILRTRYIV